MKKKTTVMLEHDSYIFLIKHGKRNAYIEKLIKERLEKLKSSFFFLRRTFDNSEIAELTEAISLPVGKWERDIKRYHRSDMHKAAVISLWEEMSRTGMKANELIAVLDEMGN